MAIAQNKTIVQVSFPLSGNSGFKTLAFPHTMTVDEARNMAASKGGISQDERLKYGLYLPDEDVWMKEEGKIELYKLKDRAKIECKLRPVDMLVCLDEDQRMLPIDFSKPVSTLIGYICEKFNISSDCNLSLEGSDLKSVSLDSQKTLYEYHPQPGSKLILKKKTKIGGKIFRRSESFKKNSPLKSSNDSEPNLSSSSSGKIFGAPLEAVCDENYGGVPAIVAKTIDYIEKEGLKLEGIFRISGNQIEIQNMKKAFDSGNDVNIRSCSSPHIASGLLKLYLRELPEPLFTFALYETFLGIFTSVKNQEARIKYFKILIDSLPTPNRITLLRLLPFLAEVVKYEDINKMAIHNVATVFGPNLLKSSDDSAFIIIQDTACINGVTCDIVKNYEFLMKPFSHEFTAYGKTLYAYTRNSPHELSFSQSEYVFIVKEEEGWLEAEINGQKGFVPANYVEVIQKINKTVAAAQEPKKLSSNNNNNNSNSSVASAAGSGGSGGGVGNLAAAAASAASAIGKQPVDRKRPERKEAGGEDSGMSKKQLLQELDDLKKLIFRQQSTRAKLESLVSQLTVQLRDIQTAIQENNFSSGSGGGDAAAAGGVTAAQLSNLRNEHRRMQGEVDRLRGISSSMNVQITEVTNALMRAQRELQDLTDEKQNLQNDIATLNDKIESMKEAAPTTPSGSRREPPSRRVIPIRQTPP